MTQTKVEAPFVANNFAHFKNLVINGDFRIFQRASGSTAVGNGTYSTADRFKTHFSNDGAATSQQHTLSDADRATTGHSFAWQWDVGTADGTIGSGQTCYFRQFIEAQNCSGLAYGSSAAKTLTLSFWVKSAKTGTYCCTIEKHDSTTYNLPLEYTISSADTWEHKTLVVSPTAGSTSFITGSAGDIAQDNGKGITLYWWLALGSDYTGGTNNTWTSNTNHLATTNQVNWLDSTDNNFYITGIQFEIGDQATDFEHLPFDVQLQRCQRYCRLLKMSGLHLTYQFSTTWSRCNPTYANAGSEMRDIPSAAWLSATPTYDSASQAVTDDENKFAWAYNGATVDTSPSSTVGIDNIGFFSLSVYNNAINHSSNGSNGVVIFSKQATIVLDAEL